MRFSFDVAPVLSEFDLIELKIELYDNNLLIVFSKNNVRKPLKPCRNVFLSQPTKSTNQPKTLKTALKGRKGFCSGPMVVIKVMH